MKPDFWNFWQIFSESHHPSEKGDSKLHPAINPPLMTSLCTGPALPKSETSNFSASQFSCFCPQNPQYTCYFEKGHAKNQKKRPLPGKPQVSSRNWFLPKIDKSVGIINQSDILPHPHGCHRHVLPNGTTKTYF